MFRVGLLRLVCYLFGCLLCLILCFVLMTERFCFELCFRVGAYDWLDVCNSMSFLLSFLFFWFTIRFVRLL